MKDIEQVSESSVSLQTSFRHEGVDVISVDLIADKHGQSNKRITELFWRNFRQFELGKDYFLIQKEDILSRSERLRNYVILFRSNRQRNALLFTESGYLKLVKP